MIKNKTYNVGIYDEFWRFFMICVMAKLNEWVKGYLGSIYYQYEHKLNSFNISSDSSDHKYKTYLLQDRWGINSVWMKEERCVPSSLGIILRQPARTVQACESGHILLGVRKSSPKQKCSNPFGETILEFSSNFFP